MLRRAALALALLVAVPSCAVFAALPVIIAAVIDAMQIIDSIADFVDKYFASQPTMLAQKQASDDAISAARQSLNKALRASRTAESQADVDAAFADFRGSYKKLLVTVEPYGVHSGVGFQAAPGVLVVPEPEALTLRAE